MILVKVMLTRATFLLAFGQSEWSLSCRWIEKPQLPRLKMQKLFKSKIIA
jgi:hypothetical protein